MAKNEFVVLNPANDLFLTGFVGETPMWGSLSNAITYSTLEEAEAQAAAIGGGTVGTPK